MRPWFPTEPGCGCRGEGLRPRSQAVFPGCFLEKRQQVAKELGIRWVGFDEGMGIKGYSHCQRERLRPRACPCLLLTREREKEYSGSPGRHFKVIHHVQRNERCYCIHDIEQDDILIKKRVPLKDKDLFDINVTKIF